MKKTLLMTILFASLSTYAVTNTPAQTEGPFYPRDRFAHATNDLTHNFLASGESIIIDGIVTDQNGIKYNNARVEIWQTDGLDGRYLVEESSKKLDPYFDYLGFQQIDLSQMGSHSFQFKTVRPKEYEATETWIRPDHIHFKIWIDGKEKLTTQMYFADDKVLIEKDLILQRLTPEQRKSVIVNFEHDEEQSLVFGKKIKRGFFHIVISK